MLESEALIQKTLSIAGEILDFTTFTIRGIPGSLVTNVKDFSSPYDIERQDYDFRVATSDFLANNITDGSEFSYTIGNITLAFIITSFNYDLDGWTSMRTSVKDITYA